MTEKKHSRFEHNRKVALQLFASQGFAQVSLRKLATHMGMSTAALYSHCSSKEELLFDALEEHYENILTIVSRPLRNNGLPRQRLQQISRAIAELYQHGPWLFQLANRERHCLGQAHRQQIEQLRQLIGLHMQQLYAKLLDEPKRCSPAIGQLALNLLEQLPLWLSEANVNAEQQLQLIEHLIQGFFSRLPELREAPAIVEEPHYAELQRRSA
ncbi:TetR/AcrR family transcriptional regulator [Ectopseudomonas mendocina]|uniref:TetR/AcrR family transcriptional regulator n=1 Tax=Ectopseudomonas mendocina TaxID=300 RepID=A0ABZ2RK44_ECTME